MVIQGAMFAEHKPMQSWVNLNYVENAGGYWGTRWATISWYCQHRHCVMPRKPTCFPRDPSTRTESQVRYDWTRRDVLAPS